MNSPECIECGGPISPRDETCPQCGALTELGIRRENEHRRSWQYKGSFKGAFSSMMVVLLVALAVLVLAGFAALLFVH